MRLLVFPRLVLTVSAIIYLQISLASVHAHPFLSLLYQLSLSVIPSVHLPQGRILSLTVRNHFLFPFLFFIQLIQLQHLAYRHFE